MSQKAVIIRSTEASFEPRYQHALATLEASGYQVHEIGWLRSERARENVLFRNKHSFAEFAPYGSGIRNLKSHFHFARFSRRVIKDIDPDLIYCCDFDTLLPALFVKQRKVIIFDQFDPISSRFTLPRPFSWIMRFVEGLAGLMAEIRISANLDRVPSLIQRKYIELPNCFPLVLENSFKAPDTSSQKHFKILVYGGILARDRGLSFVASNIGKADHWKFQVYGFGPERENLQRLVSEDFELNERVDHRELIKIASGASAILALYNPRVPNNQMTASNKLFEACQLGVPLITNRGITLGDVVERHKLGLVIDFLDETSLIEALKSLSNLSKTERQEIKSNMAKFLDAEKMKFAQTTYQIRKQIAKNVFE